LASWCLLHIIVPKEWGDEGYDKDEQDNRQDFTNHHGIRREEIGGKKMDLVIHHELRDVTPEMIDWWWDNIDTTERYRMWHPESHLTFAWEGEEGSEHIGKTHRVTEIVGGATVELRIRWEDPDRIPIERIYSHANAGCVLDDKGEPASWALHEYEETDRGTKMRSTFRLPDGLPERFIEGLRQHNTEEMAQFPVFLPALYEKRGIK
jgi:DAPG hydrolase PhiG domain